ncbi:phosphatidylserine decarboxylase [Pyrenophora seminiperda CCB06]|uniref:Phosphatidylserine decarboxylase n=1 Tax=Pyrenophora seminiperda CCB06 TaxID=1302712 RepID=A0A3M7M4L9_9PLEO|nr:phosphatidylserine decarboxylase [Pyrenophora seminiperda CCB06]
MFAEKMANRLSHSLDEIESHTPIIKSQDGNTGDDIVSKNGESISEGDHVYTRIRGGRHEGNVEKIVTTKEEADKEGVKHPPKVLFTDQKGKPVAHNPGTLDVPEKA